MIKLKLIVLLLLFSLSFCKAQNAVIAIRHNLDRRVTLDIKKESISDVMDKISKAGDFYFSYSGKLFKQDSLVTIKVQQVPVREVLDKLFDGKVDYKEMGEYIILRYAANHFTIEPENIITAEKLYVISGHVIDTETGRKVKQASVYEKQLIKGTVTNDEGYFSLTFKGDVSQVILTVSKEYYRDTTLIFLSDIKVKPEGYKGKDDENGNFFSNSIENLGISRFFISSRQRIQSLNIPNFFANSPFQASLTPGLSSHGMMSSQVVNKASLNVLGGYTAGTDGVEIAGMFNITKGNVKKMQIAGLFNGVGGSVDGFQIAGALNDVRTSVEGFQVAGLVNHVREEVKGVQIAGMTNIVYKTSQGTQIAGLANISGGNAGGMQIAGVTNIASKNMRGGQIAGLGNIASTSFKGVQIAGLFNYAKELHGLQIGLINASEQSTGTSIGLINYVHNGYKKLSISANETFNTNIAFKMGNANLYNIIFIGKNFSGTQRLETAGLGFGHDFIFSNRFSTAAEISSQYVYLGNFDYANFMNRFQLNIQYQIVKCVTIFSGPVYAIYTSEAPAGSAANGYKQQVAPAHHHSFSNNTKGWFGWNAGITLN